MANIVIREILPSDTFSAMVDKVNYNFDQLLLSGGGPIGLTGSLGDIGPMGVSGTRIFTNIDIVDKTSEISTWPTIPGDPNKYYPVTTGSLDKIGKNTKSLRHNDLYIQEGDDNYNTIQSYDGDIWVYSVITNCWLQTGNNIKGSVGTTGSSGLNEWTRDILYSSNGRDYLYPTEITTGNRQKLVLGSFINILENPPLPTLPTVDTRAIINITTDAGHPDTINAINIVDIGEDATNGGIITVYGGGLKIEAPNYASKSIRISAINSIDLDSNYTRYKINETVLIDPGLPPLIPPTTVAHSHYFTGGPINIDLGITAQDDFFRINRVGRSALAIYPTTSSVNDKILILPLAYNAKPTDSSIGNKDILISMNSSMGIGPISVSQILKSRFVVCGSAVIGPQDPPSLFIGHTPGNYNLSVYGRIGIGTKYDIDILGIFNLNNSKLVITDDWHGNSTINLRTIYDNDPGKLLGLYLSNNTIISQKYTKEASILYSPYYNDLRIAVKGYPDSIYISPTGKFTTGYRQDTYQFASNGNARLLCDSSNVNSGFEFLRDMHTSMGGITDDKIPVRRGIVVGMAETSSGVINSFGFVNFYKHSLENSLYNHPTRILPNYSQVNSSRFNFRTYNETNAFSLFSVNGVNETTTAIQIGTEYNLSLRIGAHARERTTYEHTSIHARKNTSNLGNIMTGLMLENHVDTSLTNASTDLDFYMTDSTNVQFEILNTPQARIRANVIGGSPVNKICGNLLFYTSNEMDLNLSQGNNKLELAMTIDSSQNITMEHSLYVINNINVDGITTINGPTYTKDVLYIEGTAQLKTNMYINTNCRIVSAAASDARIGLGTILPESPFEIYKSFNGYVAQMTNTSTSNSNGLSLLTNAYSGDILECSSNTQDGTGTSTKFKVGNKGEVDIKCVLSTHPALSILGTTDCLLKLRAPTANYYMGFYRETPTPNTRIGYIGYIGDDYLTIKNDIATNNVVFFDCQVGINSTDFNFGTSPLYVYHENSSIWTPLNAPVNPTLLKLSVGGGIMCQWIVNYSDKRRKENIQTIQNPLDRILKLNPVFYTWKETNIPSFGFIAQEVEEFIPEVVRIGKTDEYEDGKTYALNYEGIFTVAVAAIQEQQKMIEEKDKKIVELEKRLANIEKILNI